MKRYATFEELIANENDWELFCKIDEIFMRNAAENASGWDGYEDAVEEDELDDFIFDVSTDERMSQIHTESLEVFFDETHRSPRFINPEASKLYDWFRQY